MKTRFANTDVDYAFGLNCVISMVIEIKTIIHAGFLSGGGGGI